MNPARGVSSTKTIPAVFHKEGSTLHPLWITGFSDAEASFGLDFVRKSSSRTGWQILPVFKIHLHKKDLALLQQIQSYFNNLAQESGQECHGHFLVSGDMAMWRVGSMAELNHVILPHFDKYPLITKKLADYLLFRDAVKLMRNKEHLNLDGLGKIVNIKASLNLGLSDELQAVFPNTIKVNRPVVKSQAVPHGMWMAGFTSGEGCFLVSIFKSTTTKLGYTSRLRFSVTQHSRDELLLRNFVTYFACGRYSSRTSGAAGDFLCSNFSDIVEKIIPFFDEYPIMGSKLKDYDDWKKVAELMTSKAHLQAEGLDNIRKISTGMNRGRLQD